MTLAFRTVGIIAKPSDDRLYGALETLVSHLHARDVGILLDQATLPDLAILRDAPRVDRNELGEKSDLVIAVGGDGTLINAAHCMAAHDKPVLGINLGRLGFLVDISPDELTSRLDRILAGEYIAERRFLLSGEVIRAGKTLYRGVVFNDLVYKVRDAVRMIEFETHIDGKYLLTQRSDGMVVSTPSGSTAYALSAGGPILTPGLEAIVLAPICPHTLSNRPIVVPAESVVEIMSTHNSRANSLVSFDGQTMIDMEPDDRLRITRAEHPARLIHPSDYDYFHILRAKLRWGGHP
ncbi:MAG: NAD(+) kinase [Halothiobacillaceae bacterium]|nr:MAG: NAD(+) kinase [Halothiobacillaceae bacterium]